MSRRTPKSSDPRHCLFRTALEAYWRLQDLHPDFLDLPWSAGDAGALSAFLKANPNLTGQGFTRLLAHRLDSDDYAPGEPVKIWIGSLTRYAQGPLNKYRQPKGRPHAAPQANRADEKRTEAASSTSAALARVRGVADRGDRQARLPDPQY